MDLNDPSLTVGRCPIDGELVVYPQNGNAADLDESLPEAELPVCPDHQAQLEDLGADATQILAAAKHAAAQEQTLYLR